MMWIFFLFPLLLIPLVTQAGDRLNDISDSMGDSFFSFNWFSKDKEKEVLRTEKMQKQDQARTKQEQDDTQSTCIKQKVYSLNVRNPEQYKRLEDYPYTYECVTPH